MGGAGQYALRLSNALRSLGVESNVLLPGGPVPDGAIGLRRSDGGARRFAARLFRSVCRRISLTPYHSVRGLELYQAPQAIRPGDIVHLQGLTDWVGLAGLSRLVPQTARVFQTVHGPWEVSGGCVILAGTECQQFTDRCQRCPALRHPWKRLARLELAAKRAFVRSLAIRPIANSAWTADLIRNSCVFRGSGPPPIIPPVVHEAYLRSGFTDLRGQIGIPKERWVISIGARCVTDQFKGLPEFLQQVAAEHELSRRVSVLLFGEGRIKHPDNLDVIELGGISDPSKLADVLFTSDVFVSPSRLESFGMALVEAQAVGRPVVGFETGGIRDAVCPALSGNLVPLGRWDRLLKAVVASLVNGNGRGNSPSLREWARASFAASAVAARQMQVYELACTASR